MKNNLNILKILELFSIYSIRIWRIKSKVIIGKDKFLKISRDDNLKNNNSTIINLISDRKLKSGWYFIGLNQNSLNRNCSIKVFTKKRKFIQKRDFYPNRNRWRIIRISKNDFLNVSIDNVEHNIKLKNIWLIKIPTILVYLRIHTYIRVYRNILSTNRFGTLKEYWKIYNKIHFMNLQKKSFVRYQKWITEVEKKVFQNLRKKNKNKFSLDNFLIIPFSNVKKFPNDKWLMFYDLDFRFKDYAKDILNFFLSTNDNVNIIYTDEDQINIKGERINPDFKSSWDKELFFTWPNFSGTWIIKSNIWNTAFDKNKKNRFKNEFLSVLLEIIKIIESDSNSQNKIYHLPMILAHKKLSKSKNLNNKNSELRYSIFNEQLKTNKKFLHCNGFEINNDLSNIKYNWELKNSSKLSILIPIRDKVELLKQCLNSFEICKPGIDIEVIIIDNDSKCRKTISFLNDFIQNKNIFYKRKVIKVSGEFNFSKLNNIGFQQTSGDVILLLNNDVVFASPYWGKELASNALRNDIGCVGSKLLFHDKTIQHSGIILGMGGVAGHIYKYLENNNKLMHKINSQREYSAVTGACLAISRENWMVLNGLDSKNLKVNYNDVDLCLRCRELGLRNIILPQVLAFHFESKSRGRPIGRSYIQWKLEAFYLKKRWRNIIRSDPYFNPNLSLINEKGGLSANINKNLRLR